MSNPTDPFLDAWASAVVARKIADEVLQHIEESGEKGAANIRVIEPVHGTFPDHPLDTALRDLALATQAASHAAEAASRAAEPAEDALAIAAAALLAARALALAEDVATSPVRRSDPAERTPVVHAIAATAFAAAQIHESGRHRDTRRRYESPGFPASWHRLIDILSSAINECDGAEAPATERTLVSAAIAARDSAEAARHAYIRLQAGGAASPGLLRFVRVVSLAAAYAGCAALVPVRRR